MKESNRIMWLPVLSALLLGLARLPLHLGVLSYCGFIPLLFFLESKPSPGAIFKAAFLFSLVYSVVSLHWIVLVTLPGFLGMILLFGLYFTILFYLNRIVWEKNHFWRYPGFILLWLSFEHLQSYGQFCFPWFYTGYSLGDYPQLLQPAEIGGITFISLFILITNVLIYLFIRSKRICYPVVLLALHLLWTGASVYRYHTISLKKSNESIGIVQVSIPQDLKWDDAFKDTTLSLYREYALRISPQSSMIIFPESAIPGYVLSSYKYGRFMRNLTRTAKKSIFTGFPEYVYDEQQDEYLYYNSCTLFDSLGRYKEIYRKNILVPFGERMPLMSIFPVLNRIDFGQANWEYGKELKYYKHNGLDFSTQICFEIAFPTFNARIADKDPDFIINLTNDAWFMYSAGTYQHSIMTRFRAIENRIQYYRAANTGYSLVVDPRGDILQKSSLFSRETLEERVYHYPGKSCFVRHFYVLPDALTILTVIFLFWSILIPSKLKDKANISSNFNQRDH